MPGTPPARAHRAAARRPRPGRRVRAHRLLLGRRRVEPVAPTAPVDLGKADDVKVGASKLYTDHNVVVSRIADDEYTAYSTICTHARCPIERLEGRKLICQCHGSQFDATNGKVLKEPAVKPLPELPVKVENGKIIAGPEA